MGFYIAIMDYEMGNLKSVYKLLVHLNVETIITDNSKQIIEADGVILPGVGAFGDAMNQLKKKNLIPVLNQIRTQNHPLLGICLGMQLLFTNSTEMGSFGGLDIIKGDVVFFDKSKVDKVPQIGWNNVKFVDPNHYIFQGIQSESFFYFVHSYYVIPSEKKNNLGLTCYGDIEFCSVVTDKNIVATQFHPEKSGKNGVELINNFVNHCRK